MGSYNFKVNTSSYHSINDNLTTLNKLFQHKNGYFGIKGKAKVKSDYYRQINSNNPLKTAKLFYEKIANGGIEKKLPNGAFVTKLKDGTIITFREITSTAGSPAIDINIKKSSSSSGIKNQKIHFEGN